METTTLNHKENTNQTKTRISRREKLLMRFFANLNIPERYREVIRLLWLASEGRSTFEVSYLELAKLSRKEPNKKKMQSLVKNFLKWQEKNKVEVLKLLSFGKRMKKDDGSFEFLKNKYELLFLADFQKVIDGLKERISYKKLEPLVDEFSRSYTNREHSITKIRISERKQFNKDKETVKTKLKKLYNQNPKETLELLANISGSIAEQEQLRVKREEQKQEAVYKKQIIESVLMQSKETVNSSTATIYKAGVGSETSSINNFFFLPLG
jgi:hypothetical protein